MERRQIKAALAAEYRIIHSVYASMEKQADAAQAAGKMRDFRELKKKAQRRAGTMRGIRRAAAALGIPEAELLEAVEGA